MAADRAPALRPLGVGDVLDELFAIYRRGFKAFIGISALVDIPVAILFLPFVPLYATLLPQANRGFGGDPGRVLGDYVGWGIAGLVIGIVAAVAHLLWLAATCLGTAAVYLGEKPSIGGAYRLALGRLWALVRLAFLGGLIVAGMTTLAFAPLVVPPLLCVSMPATLILGTLLLVKWCLAVPALVLEQQGAIGALRRSWHLVTGGWWRTFATLLVLGLIVGVLQGLAGGLQEAISGLLQALAAPGTTIPPAWILVIGSLLGSAVGLLWGPLMYIGLTLMYYDRRVRVEAYDLTVLAQDMLRQQRPEPASP